MRLAVSKVEYKSRALLPRPRREEVVVYPFLPIIHLLVKTDWVAVFVHLSAGACGDSKKAPGRSDLKLQEGRSQQKWVPGIGLKSSAGATGTLNQ